MMEAENWFENLDNADEDGSSFFGDYVLMYRPRRALWNPVSDEAHGSGEREGGSGGEIDDEDDGGVEDDEYWDVSGSET